MRPSRAMLGIEQMASLHASILGGAPWEEILRRERVTRAQWLAAERACLDALEAESRTGGIELRDRYLRAFHGEPTPSVAAPIEALAPSVPAPLQRPSFELAARAPEVASPSAVVARITSGPAAAPAWMPPSMRGFADVEGTQIAPEGAALEAALPFEPDARASTPPPSQAVPPLPSPSPNRGPAPSRAAPMIPAGMRGFADVEGTQIAPEGAVIEAALPFEPDARASAPPSSQAVPARPTGPVIPAGMRGFADVEGTQLAPSAPSGPSLPFAAAAAVASSMASPPVASSAASPPRAPARPATLASAAAPMPLQQYASLRVELDLHPQRAAETLRRYHVADAQLAALDALWSARIASDPQLRAAWDAAYASYRAWLVGGRAT